MGIKKLPKGKKSPYEQSLKNTVCLELLSGRLSITEAKATYGIKGQGTIYKWIEDYKKQLPISNLPAMNANNPDTGNTTDQQNPATEDLVKKNKELQQALELAKLKITALEVMIDIAETELNIDIRKKSGTKQ